MDPKKLNDRCKVEAEINRRVKTDKKFKEELFKNPKAALTSYFKLKFPDSLKIKIEKEPANTWTILITRQAPPTPGELDEPGCENCGAGTGMCTGA